MDKAPNGSYMHIKKTLCIDEYGKVPLHAGSVQRVRCLEQQPTPIFHHDVSQVHMHYQEAETKTGTQASAIHSQIMLQKVLIIPLHRQAPHAQQKAINKQCSAQLNEL